MSVPSHYLCTRDQVASLQENGFITDFEKHRTHFTQLIRVTHIAASNIGDGALPTSEVISKILNIVLQEDVVFRKMIIDKIYIPPRLIGVFTEIFAKYAVSELWLEVVQSRGR